MLLLQLCTNLFQLMELSGKEVEALFFDLTKTFDSVPHHAFLKKLEDIQMHEPNLAWVLVYLTDTEDRQWW